MDNITGRLVKKQTLKLEKSCLVKVSKESHFPQYNIIAWAKYKWDALHRAIECFKQEVLDGKRTSITWKEVTDSVWTHQEFDILVDLTGFKLDPYSEVQYHLSSIPGYKSVFEEEIPESRYLEGFRFIKEEL